MIFGQYSYSDIHYTYTISIYIDMHYTVNMYRYTVSIYIVIFPNIITLITTMHCWCFVPKRYDAPYNYLYHYMVYLTQFIQIIIQ